MTVPVVYHPDYSVPLPPGHRFPMEKFRRLFELLLAQGLVAQCDVHRPQPASPAWVERAHTPDYVNGICARNLHARAVRRIGLPLSEAMVRRSLAAVSGTVLTARLALEHGIACNTAGGSHHAFSGHGSGYCVFNDVSVAARTLLAEGLVERVLVIDLDVHQGDGTAEIHREDPAVFTFSMHCETNFPPLKESSDRDVALAAGTGDDDYLAVLEGELAVLLPSVAPDLVFYNAGVDAHVSDRLGRLSLTEDGIASRDRIVLGACRKAGVPVAGVIGGGYLDEVDDLVRLHSHLVRAAVRESRAIVASAANLSARA